MTEEHTPWWVGAVGYEVYARSFECDLDDEGATEGIAPKHRPTPLAKSVLDPIHPRTEV